MQAVILAAGRGKRLKELTDDLPKVMMPIYGMPLLTIHFKILKELGVEETILIVHYKKEKIIEHFGDEFEGMKLKYVEQKEMKGTADAVLTAEKYITEDKFLAIAGDVIYHKELIERIINNHKKSDGVLTVCEVNDATRFGVIEHKEGVVKKIVEKSPNPPTNLANASVYCFPKEIFEACKKIEVSPRGEYEITDAIQLLIDQDKKFEFETIQNWLDIGTKEQLKEADKVVHELGLIHPGKH